MEFVLIAVVGDDVHTATFTHTARGCLSMARVWRYWTDQGAAVNAYTVSRTVPVEESEDVAEDAPVDVAASVRDAVPDTAAWLMGETRA